MINIACQSSPTGLRSIVDRGDDRNIRMVRQHNHRYWGIQTSSMLRLQEWVPGTRSWVGSDPSFLNLISDEGGFIGLQTRLAMSRGACDVQHLGRVTCDVSWSVL